MVDPVRFGVLGAANIARSIYCRLPSVQRGESCSRSQSRSRQGARAFATEVGIPRTCDSYDALLADRAIDAVYIPLPNAMHAEWAIRAAKAGKHVLCEKPIALNAQEARAMYEAAERHRVILREGYPYLAQAQTTMLRAWLASDAIGRLTLIRSTFGVRFSDPANIRLRPDAGRWRAV